MLLPLKVEHGHSPAATAGLLPSYYTGRTQFVLLSMRRLTEIEVWREGSDPDDLLVLSRYRYVNRHTHMFFLCVIHACAYYTCASASAPAPPGISGR